MNNKSVGRGDHKQLLQQKKWLPVGIFNQKNQKW